MQSDQNRWENDKFTQVMRREDADTDANVEKQQPKLRLSPLLIILIGIIILLTLAIAVVVIRQQRSNQNNTGSNVTIGAQQVEVDKEEITSEQTDGDAIHEQDNNTDDFEVDIVDEAGLIAEGDPLEGNWVRYDDDTHVAGMTVAVVNNGGVLEGHIIQMMDGIGIFNVGQVKWHNIKKISENRYDLDDLFNINNGQTWSVSDIPSHITIIKDGQRLTLITDRTEGTGNHQIWEKMDE